MKVPEGYLFSTASAEIKYKNRDDLALIYSLSPATVSAVFTKNKIKAAPVIYSKNILKSNNKINAILINSGNANACTGEQGLLDCNILAEELSFVLNISKDSVLISSTGVIGVKLPVEKLINKFSLLKDNLSADSIESVSKAIMTTDSFNKIYSLQKDDFTICGIAKGAGMINPDMATMLAFILTDAKLPKLEMDRILLNTVEKTFNSICVDGDTSTNDSVFLISNEVAQNVDIKNFEDALYEVCINLAKMIVKDGEGATKFIKIKILNGKSEKDCKKIGETLSKSLLVKTAFFGNDPNWGRIIAAIGYSGVEINPDKIEIYLGDLPVVKYGIEDKNFSEKEVANYLYNNNNIELVINLNSGHYSWEYYTCDLSYDYVKINSEYRT